MGGRMGQIEVAPDYMICVDCETPCYVFEWKDGVVVEALCEACGNDDPDEFLTEDEFEALATRPLPRR